MNDFSLSGKIAIVTGANGKLGRVWVEALAHSGAAVVATDIGNDGPCDDIARLMGFFAEKISFIDGIDIMKREDALRLCEYCKKTYGIADVLVNNAGIDQPPASGASKYTIEDYPEDIFSNILKVNTYGAFNLIGVFGAEMIKATKDGSGRGGGSIINIGSLYASVSPDEKFYDHMDGFLKPPSYGMSKAAVVNMTKYLAAHWGKYGIRVNTLSPGGVEGGQDPEFKRKFCDRVPLGRMAQLDDLKGPLVFLASDASKYVTGIELKVDGGFTVL